MAKRRGNMLLVVIVMTTVLSLFLAMAMIPSNTIATRMRERELVYRGEHIAMGIRRFYNKFGRFPYELEELLSQEPRFVRQLYKDPMTKDGEWTLVYLAATDTSALAGLNRALGRAVEQATGQATTAEVNSENQAEQGPGNLFEPGRQQITGVRSRSDQQGLLVRDDSSIYADWLFTALPKKEIGLEGLGDAGGAGLPTAPSPPSLEPGDE